MIKNGGKNIVNQGTVTLYKQFDTEPLFKPSRILQKNSKETQKIIFTFFSEEVSNWIQRVTSGEEEKYKIYGLS